MRLSGARDDAGPNGAESVPGRIRRAPGPFICPGQPQRFGNDRSGGRPAFTVFAGRGWSPNRRRLPMCEQCVGEDAFPRRRFLRLAAAGAAGAVAVASLDSQVAHAKPATTTNSLKTFAAVPAPAIVTRAEWGADESIR